MLWIIILFSISISIGMFAVNAHEHFVAYAYNLNEDKDEESIRKKRKIWIICAIITIIGWYSLNKIYSLSYDEVSQTGEWELLAFTDSGKISAQGSFYIHIDVDTDVNTFFYLDNTVKVKSDSIDIIEGYNGIPYVEEYTNYSKNEFEPLFYVLTFDIKKEFSKSYKIYIPEGGILKTTEFSNP